MSRLDQATLDYLYTLRRRGIKIGLHRTIELLNRCNNPHKGIPIVHIAGTNGKGSTAAMIASILKISGLKVGLYTSPHLVKFNERIRINGIPISDEFIISFLKHYQETINLLGSTFFETTTAMMYSLFAHENVDIGVIEVGMGGRLDSSNVCESIASVITTIDFDHMEYLGNTLTKIATEKAGIIKSGIPVITTNQKEEVLTVIEKAAKKNGAPLFFASDLCPISNFKQNANGISFRSLDTFFSSPFLGSHQVANAQTAIATCRMLESKIKEEKIAQGIKKTIWPGRLQLVWQKPIVYFDVGHNPNGVHASLNTLIDIYPDIPIQAICAIKKNKDVKEIAKALCKKVKDVITIEPTNSEFYNSRSLATLLSNEGIKAKAAPSLLEGIQQCKLNPSYISFIFGTHYIANTVFSVFEFPFDKESI
tara:strand:- start:12358 stop:13626 length:1269 start_codon:yes stop_codon:yes gene_type:complete